MRFFGEYDCRLDEKGRVKMPTALLRQIPTEAQNQFVIIRGFEPHLVLYPRSVWDNITEKLDKLNSYDRKTRDFRRYFYRGATEITLDASGRLLLPKHLLEWGKIEKDLILFAHTNNIEVWNKEMYDTSMSIEPDEFSKLAQEILGTNNQDDSGN
jgi:MraZ protein